MGFDQTRYMFSSAAPLSPTITDFFAGLGMQILNLYGQSECTGLCSFNRPARNRIGSVGPALPSVELRIADDGEILTRGPNNFLGYLNDPAATAATWMTEGFLHTGRRRAPRRRGLPVHHRSQEGHHHHRRRGERDPVAHRSRAQEVPPHRGGHRHRRRAALPHRADLSRRRGGDRGWGSTPPRSVPAVQAAVDEVNRGAGPGAADQEVHHPGSAPVDRARRADPHAEGEAEGGPGPLRRRDRRDVPVGRSPEPGRRPPLVALDPEPAGGRRPAGRGLRPVRRCTNPGRSRRYPRNVSPIPSRRRWSAVTGRATAAKPGSASTRFGKSWCKMAARPTTSTSSPASRQCTASRPLRIFPAAPSRTRPRSRSVKNDSSGRPRCSSSSGSLNTSQSDRSRRSINPSLISRWASRRISVSLMPKRSGESRTASDEAGPAPCPDAGDHVAEEPRPVLQGAAEAVGASVHLGAEELGEHVPVGAVDLHPVEAGPFGAGGGGDEVLGQLLHLGKAQAARAFRGVVRRTYRRRADEGHRRAHAGVVELHQGQAALGLDGGGQPGQSLQVVVGEDPELAGEALPLRLHVRRAGQDEAEPAPGEPGEPGEVVRPRPGRPPGSACWSAAPA